MFNPFSSFFVGIWHKEVYLDFESRFAMKYTLLLTSAMVLIAMPFSAKAEDSRTAGYGQAIEKSAPVAATPYARRVRPSQPAQEPSGLYVRQSDNAPNGGLGPADSVRSELNFSSSPELDAASEASVLQGKRLDAKIRDHNLSEVPRIQELGF